jgi:ABC-type branched-subunit amino acid transport system substrate-binding protein
MGVGRAVRRQAGRATRAGTRVGARRHLATQLRRGRLIAINAIVVVGFSAVTVDALTRSDRVPAQGTLGKTLLQHKRHAGQSAAARSGRATGAPAADVAETGSSGRRLIAPGVVVSRPGTTRGTRRTSDGGKQLVHRTPAKTTPGAVVPSPVDMTIAYPATSTLVALNSGLGLRETPGDTAAQARAVVHWVNANGGVGGHPVRLRLLTYDPAEGTGFSAAFAPACAAAASGPKPLAVLAPLQDAEIQSGCLAARQLVLVGDGPAAGDDQVYKQAGNSLFAPGSMSLDRIAREEASYLTSKGFLTRGSRVGIVRIDSPTFARVSRTTLHSAVEAAGGRVVAEATVPRPYAVTDVPTVLAAVRAAVLQLRTAVVDRVIMLDAGVVAPLFMRVAQRQAYNPRYGLNSTMAPAALANEVPAAQLAGAIGVGYSAPLDVASADAPPSADRNLCNDIYKGVDLGGSFGHYSAVALCGQFLTIRAALAGVSDPTPARLSAELEGLGPAPGILALTSRLDASHHDGASSVRPLAFDGDCTCIRYAGDARDAR